MICSIVSILSSGAPSTFRIRTTVAPTAGCMHSCTTNASAARSSGPPKNGMNTWNCAPSPALAPVPTPLLSSSPEPCGAPRSQKSATSAGASAKTRRTKCECAVIAFWPPLSCFVWKSASNGEGTGLVADEGEAVAAAVASVGESGTSSSTEEPGALVHGRMTIWLAAARACCVTFSEKSSLPTTARAVETTMRWR